MSAAHAGCAREPIFPVCADLAAAAAAVISTDGHQSAVYELGGDEAFTLADLAAGVAAHSGKPVGYRYRDLTQDEFAAVLESNGLPAPIATMLAEVDATIRGGSLQITTGHLHSLIGRTPLSMDEAVAAALNS